MPKATVHVILASLESAQFLVRTAEGYQIGIGAFEIGTAMPAAASLRQAAAPWLDRLTLATQESCHLGMLSAGDVVYLDRRDSPGDGLRFTVRIGQRLPAYGTALGKAMLSQLTDAEISQLYPSDLPPVTEATLRSRAELLELLGDVRHRGFATESEESTAGVRCVGVAVAVPHGVVGLSVTAPVHRAGLDDLLQHVPLLREAIGSLRSAAVAGHWLHALPGPSGSSDGFAEASVSLRS